MKTTTRRLTETGVLIAMALALLFLSKLIVPFFQLPFGGEVTFVSMLPIVLIGYRFGTRCGLFGAFAYSLVRLLVGSSTIAAMPGDGLVVWQILLICLIDYILAFTVLGFGGLFRNRFSPSGAIALGAMVALALSYFMHWLSGFIFYGAWAEWFFSDVFAAYGGQWFLDHFSGNGLAALYSLIYNGCYMVPEIILSAIAGFFVGKIPAVARKA